MAAAAGQSAARAACLSDVSMILCWRPDSVIGAGGGVQEQLQLWRPAAAVTVPLPKGAGEGVQGRAVLVASFEQGDMHTYAYLPFHVP